MAIDFSSHRNAAGMSAAEDTLMASQEAPQPGNELELVLEYDIQTDRQQLSEAMVGTPEIDSIVSTVDVYNLETIVTFGAEAAEEISKASDIILRSTNMSQLDDSSEMMKVLARVMEKFDPDEFTEKTGLLGRLFTNVNKQMEKILAKYHTMGDEIDKIYVELKSYESEIKVSNRKLNQLFDANVEYYHNLVKYIMAGEQACKEIDQYIEQRQSDFERTGDNSIQFELTTLKQALNMMEQRTHDLRLAEAVAMQSIPMIKMMAYNNYNLVRKINSAFIITLPVFKQALAQAIMLKRQRIQAESMAALDKKTNEMLIKNANNSVETAKMTAKMASGSSVQVETLQRTWQTITDGIEETRRMGQDAKRKHNEDQAKLEAIKADFARKYSSSKQ